MIGRFLFSSTPASAISTRVGAEVEQELTSVVNSFVKCAS
jgi:hypothetical protein